jgi:predicted nuclease of predicted toxin-antitoxin system
VNFLVDNQLPVSLCRFLSARGHPSDHVLNLHMDEAPDSEIWKHISKTNQILVSKDEDFLHLANRAGDTGRLLWVRMGNCRKEALLQTFAQHLPQVLQAFDQGLRVVEIR